MLVLMGKMTKCLTNYVLEIKYYAVLTNAMEEYSLTEGKVHSMGDTTKLDAEGIPWWPSSQGSLFSLPGPRFQSWLGK